MFFHGLATFKKDWDIFHKGEIYKITAWLPEQNIFCIETTGSGATVPLLTFYWSEEDFRGLFNVERCFTCQEEDL